jgi:tetratricopeptide (TPR) repeat protein
MLAAAVDRARANFQQQPRLRGELLGELGRMQGRLGDGDESLRLLQEALALLEANAPAPDPSLNKVRAYVASAQLGAGEIERAQTLARLALRDCTAGIDCAKARYYAGVTLASVELRRGHALAAVALMRTGVVDSEAGFGSSHPETALGELGLAIFLRQAGELEEAGRALERADGISRHVKLRQADRIQLARTRAVLALDLGNYAQAHDLLQALVSTVPKGTDRAVLWRLQATVDLAQGRPALARGSAAQALASAAPASNGTERLFALQALARAMAMDGEPGAARQAMETVLAGLHEAGYADQALEILRARRFAAEIVLREGRVADALALLRPLAEAQERVRAGQDVEYAQTLELLGCAERDAGHPEAALAAHRRAAEIFIGKLPPAHPYLQRNALYQEAAAAATHPAAGAASRLTTDARAYADRFPADSLWRRSIERSEAMAGCPVGAGLGCGLVL